MPNTRASGSVTNGRGRATACLMVLTMSGSPSATTSTIISAHSRARALPKQSMARPTATASGMNQRIRRCAAQNRHEPVEERIAQRAVDEMKQARVECLQPVHCRQCSGKRKLKTQLSADKRELTLIIFRRTLPLMASSVHQQIVDSLQRLWLNDLCSWLTGFSAGKGRTRAANEDVSRN